MTSDEVRLGEFDDESLPAVLRWQVFSFLRIIWPEGFTGELRYRDWITNPVYQPYHLLYVAGDPVVSHLEIVQRLLDHEGVKYKAYRADRRAHVPLAPPSGMGWQARAAGQQMD